MTPNDALLQLIAEQRLAIAARDSDLADREELVRNLGTKNEMLHKDIERLQKEIRALKPQYGDDGEVSIEA